MTDSRASPDVRLNNGALLDALLQNPSGAPLDLLSSKTGLTAKEVLSDLESLNASGCELEIRPDQHVRLVCAHLESWLDYLRWRFRDFRSDGERVIEIYRRTTSTQDLVRRIIDRQGAAADGALAVADEQTAGRGRLGRRWLAPPGTAVLFSRACVAEEAGTAALSVDRLMLSTAIGVARAIEEVTCPNSLDAQIRWPNDILVSGRKIAGILVETSADSTHQASVIGVGINVSLEAAQLPDNESIRRQNVTSLAMCQCHVDRLRALTVAIAQLDQALALSNLDPLVDEWRQRSSLLSQHVRLQSEGSVIEGEVVDLDPYEGLIIRTDRGQLVHLNAATTTIL